MILPLRILTVLCLYTIVTISSFATPVPTSESPTKHDKDIHADDLIEPNKEEHPWIKVETEDIKGKKLVEVTKVEKQKKQSPAKSKKHKKLR